MKTNLLKKCISACFLLFVTGYFLSGQELINTDAQTLTLTGKAAPCPEFYHRVDTAKYKGMPLSVKRLFTNSTGLAVVFKTNSNVISAKWSTANPKTGNNMTAIAQRGLDLYIKNDGRWIYAGVGRPESNQTTATIVENMAPGEKECLLYLSLYDEVKSLEIGVTEGSYIKPLPDPFRKKVVIYGSSILQGASASRPGMAYPARMTRKSGINFINLGLSGNGKMEPAVADMIKDIDADAFILDCAPNPSPEEITERTAYLVKSIRNRHPNAPIIMIQTAFRESGNFNLKVRERVTGQMHNFKAEYEKLKAAGMKDLYFVDGDLMGSDHEGTTDGVHPNDIGFDRMLQIIEPAVMKILKKHGIR